MTQLTITQDVQRKLQEFTKQKELKDGYDQKVVALMASKANAVESQFLTTLDQRKIPLVSVDYFAVSENKFILVKKTFAEGEEAAVAVRIEPYGNDLIVETRQYEWSKIARQNQLTLGTMLALLGLPFFWTGIGLIVAIVGISMMFTHPKLSGARAEEALTFRKAVKETLSHTLTKVKTAIKQNVRGTANTPRQNSRSSSKKSTTKSANSPRRH